MKVVVTGSSGRVGRAVFAALTLEHDVVGIDRTPFATTRFVGDFSDCDLAARALDGADAVIHAAALHARHVGIVPDREFERVNVDGTARLAELARSAGVTRFVMTSSTALYGTVKEAGACAWIDEGIEPRPVSVYHRTKLAAERALREIAVESFAVRVLRMSRCFPETADAMAAYRLHRGIDVRDVADAHSAALANGGPDFQCYIVSGATPFRRSDCAGLAENAPAVIELRAPAAASAFRRRGWCLPPTIDRVYVAKAVEGGLGWSSRLGFEEVLAQLDRRSLEVLPVGAGLTERPE